MKVIYNSIKNISPTEKTTIHNKSLEAGLSILFSIAELRLRDFVKTTYNQLLCFDEIVTPIKSAISEIMGDDIPISINESLIKPFIYDMDILDDIPKQILDGHHGLFSGIFDSRNNKLYNSTLWLYDIADEKIINVLHNTKQGFVLIG